MIPRIVHFVWISSPACGVPTFGFTEWVAVRSAAKANPGWRVVIWTNHVPVGKYWESAKRLADIGSIEPPRTVYGNQIPHPAHKADYLRLQIVDQFGGVYLDMDTISLKCFDPLIDGRDNAVMIREVVNGTFIGLCNAFVASPPLSVFLHNWLQKFERFSSTGRDDKWNESGVRWPAEVAAQYPGHCVTLPPETFFKPDWSADGIAAMFDRVEEFPHAYGHHLWSAITRERLDKIDETNYMATDCTYSRLIEDTLGDEIRSELVSA